MDEFLSINNDENIGAGQAYSASVQADAPAQTNVPTQIDALTQVDELALCLHLPKLMFLP